MFIMAANIYGLVTLFTGTACSLISTASTGKVVLLNPSNGSSPPVSPVISPSSFIPVPPPFGTAPWCTFPPNSIYKGYTTHCGLDFYLGDIAHHITGDIAQCIDFCERTPACVAASYQSGLRSGLGGMCWLKSRVAKVQRADGWIVGMQKMDIGGVVAGWTGDGRTLKGDVFGSETVGTVGWEKASTPLVRYSASVTAANRSILGGGQGALLSSMSLDLPPWYRAAQPCYAAGCSATLATTSTSLWSTCLVEVTTQSTAPLVTKPAVTTTVSTNTEVSSAIHPAYSSSSSWTRRYSCGVVAGHFTCSSNSGMGHEVSTTTSRPGTTTKPTTHTTLGPTLTRSWTRVTLSAEILSTVSWPAFSGSNVTTSSSSEILSRSTPSESVVVPSLTWASVVTTTSAAQLSTVTIPVQGPTGVSSIAIPVPGSSISTVSVVFTTTASVPGESTTIYGQHRTILSTVTVPAEGPVATVTAPASFTTDTVSHLHTTTILGQDETMISTVTNPGLVAATTHTVSETHTTTSFDQNTSAAITSITSKPTDPTATLTSGRRTPVTKSVTAAGTWVATPKPSGDQSGGNLARKSIFGMVVGLFVSVLVC